MAPKQNTGIRSAHSTAQGRVDGTLPIITEHDLLEFHKAHYPGLVPPTIFFVDPSTVAHLLPQNVSIEEEEDDDDDDGLGYYSDGVKRTLTDEQIEMFRHSELVQIERARQLKEESSGERLEAAPLPQVDAHVAIQAEHVASLTRQKEQKDDTKARTAIPYGERHKRKWEGYIETKDSRHGSITSRRLARELDGQQSTNVELDY